MRSLNRRGVLGALVFAPGAALIATTALAQQPNYILIEPPPPRREVIPDLPAERAEVEYWQPGYWRWNGHEYGWVDGHYVARPRPRAVWVPGHWDHREYGWVFIDGHWS
jgi:hypothetical protein